MWNFFLQRQGWETYLYALLLKLKVFPENMGIRLEKKNKKIFLFILGAPYGPPQPGVRPKIGKISQV